MINQSYLQKQIQEKIRAEFYTPAEFPSVLLFQFFKKEFYLKLREQVARAHFTTNVEKLTYSYSRADCPVLLTKFLQSQEFCQFLSSIIRKPVQGIEAHFYSFTWKDYTILSDTALEQPGIDLVLDFTADWNENAGGAVVYKDEQGNFISIPIAPNLLTLVERKPSVQKYVQYINHYAQKHKRYLLLGKIKIKV